MKITKVFQSGLDWRASADRGEVYAVKIEGPVTESGRLIRALCARDAEATELIRDLLNAVLAESQDPDVESIEAVKTARAWLGEPADAKVVGA